MSCTISLLEIELVYLETLSLESIKDEQDARTNVQWTKVLLTGCFKTFIITP